MGRLEGVAPPCDDFASPAMATLPHRRPERASSTSPECAHVACVEVYGEVRRAWKVRAVADCNADTCPDPIFQNIATGDIAAWLLNGSMFIGSPSVGRVNLLWTVVGAK